MRTFPLTDALKKAFTGSGECATVDWSFLGLSMPAWALIWFLLLGIAYLVAGFRR
jgi:disulfide bond formation protein DsbB